MYLELAACRLTRLPAELARLAPNLRNLNLNYNFVEDVRPLEGLRLGDPRQLGHQADEVDAAHASDESIIFRHVAQERPDLPHFVPDVPAEDEGCAAAGRMKSEKGVEQRGLARPVRSQEADAAAGQGRAQPLEDGTSAERDLQVLELDHRRSSGRDWSIRSR